MERKAYLARWRLDPDPFQDEEAKNDAVFAELIDNYDVHPHFGKVYGNPEKPGPAVVFGPKGSGKTALRLQIEHRLREHNQAELAASAGRPGGAEGARRVRVVAYDDLNPFLDCFKSRVGGRRSSDDEVLDRLSLADHMDAILSLAVTELVSEAIDRKSDVAQGVRRLGKEQRTTLALLALFYDHPTGDDPARRWGRLWSAIRPVWLPAASVAKGLG
ncbi:MAG TPA: hypothetical protein VHF22_08710, partial [Planctomycetota bacterium]|nr:hypothetical protein [Planctomycetota bacterium]